MQLKIQKPKKIPVTFSVLEIKVPFVFFFRSFLTEDSTEYSWEVSYGLLMWLSIVVLVPFDLRSLDSADEEHPEKGFLASVVDICKLFLEDSGKTKDATSMLLANLLSR